VSSSSLWSTNRKPTFTYLVEGVVGAELRGHQGEGAAAAVGPPLFLGEGEVEEGPQPLSQEEGEGAAVAHPFSQGEGAEEAGEPPGLLQEGVVEGLELGRLFVEEGAEEGGGRKPLDAGVEVGEGEELS
jgi:hypothetical protein